MRTYARAYVSSLDEALGSLGSVTGTYRRTQATLIVDDLNECQSDWHGQARVRAGAVRPRRVPTGRNRTARLPGGIQVEYVQWDGAQWERDGGAEPPMTA